MAPAGPVFGWAPFAGPDRGYEGLGKFIRKSFGNALSVGCFHLHVQTRIDLLQNPQSSP